MFLNEPHNPVDIAGYTDYNLKWQSKHNFCTFKKRYIIYQIYQIIPSQRPQCHSCTMGELQYAFIFQFHSPPTDRKNILEQRNGSSAVPQEHSVTITAARKRRGRMNHTASPSHNIWHYTRRRVRTSGLWQLTTSRANARRRPGGPRTNSARLPSASAAAPLLTATSASCGTLGSNLPGAPPPVTAGASRCRGTSATFPRSSGPAPTGQRARRQLGRRSLFGSSDRLLLTASR